MRASLDANATGTKKAGLFAHVLAKVGVELGSVRMPPVYDPDTACVAKPCRVVLPDVSAR